LSCIPPESYPVQDLVETLCHTYLGKTLNTKFEGHATDEETEEAIGFVDDHFFFLEFDDIPRLAQVLDIYEDMAKVEKAKYFITDPFNAIAEQANDQNIAKYLKIGLTQMKRLATKNDIVNIIVEHPRSPGRDKHEASPWTLFGGSMWWNKSDVIVTLARPDDFNSPQVDVKTWKVKNQKWDGVPGTVSLYFDRNKNQYFESDLYL